MRQEGVPSYCPMFTQDLANRTAEQPPDGLGPTHGTHIPTTTLARAGGHWTKNWGGRGFWLKTMVFPP